jgi:hypothetical protein
MLGRITRSLKARGLGPTMKLALRQPYLLWRERGFNRARLSAQAEYDREHHVDTGGIVYLGDLPIPSENAAYGTRYGPTEETTFRDMMSELALDYPRFTFIDIGSGKGAVLFYASDCPFDRIIGVEFAPDLHDRAQQNIAGYHSKSQKCFNIEAVCADAAVYQLPTKPLILYFSSPFGWQVMEPVLAQIFESFKRYPREGYLIYNHIGYFPDVDDMLLAAEGLGLLSDQQTYRIYRIGHGS